MFHVKQIKMFHVKWFSKGIALLIKNGEVKMEKYRSFYHGLSNTFIYATEIKKQDVSSKDIYYYFTSDKQNCDIYQSKNSNDYYYIQNKPVKWID